MAGPHINVTRLSLGFSGMVMSVVALREHATSAIDQSRKSDTRDRTRIYSVSVVCRRDDYPKSGHDGPVWRERCRHQQGHRPGVILVGESRRRGPHDGDLAAGSVSIMAGLSTKSMTAGGRRPVDGLLAVAKASGCR